MIPSAAQESVFILYIQFQADYEMRDAQCAPLSFFSVLPEKKDSAAPGGRKKRALRAIDNSVSDTLYARLPNLGADRIQVGNLFASVSAEGFAYARAAACAKKRRPCTVYRSRSPGRIQRGAAAPLCVVSNRVVLRRGRNRNLPLLSVVSLATSLWTSKEKLNTQPASSYCLESNL